MHKSKIYHPDIRIQLISQSTNPVDLQIQFNSIRIEHKPFPGVYWQKQEQSREERAKG